MGPILGRTSSDHFCALSCLSVKRIEVQETIRSVSFQTRTSGVEFVDHDA